MASAAARDAEGPDASSGAVSSSRAVDAVPSDDVSARAGVAVSGSGGASPGAGDRYAPLCSLASAAARCASLSVASSAAYRSCAARLSAWSASLIDPSASISSPLARSLRSRDARTSSSSETRCLSSATRSRRSLSSFLPILERAPADPRARK